MDSHSRVISLFLLRVGVGTVRHFHWIALLARRTGREVVENLRISRHLASGNSESGDQCSRVSGERAAVGCRRWRSSSPAPAIVPSAEIVFAAQSSYLYVEANERDQ